MSPDPEAFKRPPGGVMHQTRKLPVSKTTITVLLITFAPLGYSVLFTKKQKREATRLDVAKVTGVADTSHTRPSK